MYYSLLAARRLALAGSLCLAATHLSSAQAARPPAGWPYLLRDGKPVTLTEAIQQRIVRPWQVICAQHIDGWVLVRFTVTPDGVVQNARIGQSLHYDCDVAALLAVRQLPQFEPLREAGKPVASEMTVPVRFNWRARQQPAK